MLHEAKWRKQNNQLKAETAREEAKQREHNRKKKRAQMGQQLKIHKLNLHEDDELSDEDVPQPIILIQIGLERKIVKALIDTGSDCNTISYDLFQTLNDVVLRPTNAVLKSFTSHITQPKGVCNLMVHVERLSCGDKFFVTHTEMQNCFFNWKNNLVHCQSRNKQRWIPLHTIEMSTQGCFTQTYNTCVT